LTDALKQVAVEPRKHHRLREALLRAFGKTKNAAALPPLQEALEDDEPEIRRAAAGAIGELEQPAGAAALRIALADSDESVRSEAADSLGRLKDAAAVTRLIECLANDTWLVRTRAAEALGKIGDPSSAPDLIAALQDGNYTVAKAAIEALGRLGDAAAISHLRPLLDRNENGQVTEMDMTVMTALVRLRDTASFSDIENHLLNFRSGSYGGEVYEELARYGDEGIQVLFRVLNNDRRNAPQSEAAKALESIRRPDIVNAVKAWRRKQR
jgi:HEAT repeat protein